MVYLGKSVKRNMYFGAKPHLFELAENMRKNPTQSEKVLWNILRKYRFKGFLFRQQNPIHLFIADFYCHRIKLVIEADGDIHLENEVQEHDDGRTGELGKLGIKVLRFTNEQILYNQDFVIKQINEFIDEVASTVLVGAGDRRG
jgi:very-short-patch-repair endonuclease